MKVSAKSAEKNSFKNVDGWNVLKSSATHSHLYSSLAMRQFCVSSDSIKNALNCDLTYLLSSEGV